MAHRPIIKPSGRRPGYRWTPEQREQQSHRAREKWTEIKAKRLGEKARRL